MNGNAIHMNSSKSHSKKSESKSNPQQSTDKSLSSSHHNHNNHTSPGALNHKDSWEAAAGEHSSCSSAASKSSQNHVSATTNHREKDKEKTYSQPNQRHAHSNGVIGHHSGDRQRDTEQETGSEVSHTDCEISTDKSAKGIFLDFIYLPTRCMYQ